MKAKTFRTLCICFVSLIMAVVLALDIVCGIFSDTLTLYISSTVALSDDLRTEGEKLATRIEEEGAVLVRNQNSCLPLDKQSANKVNVLGWSATQWIMGGSGTGRSVQLGSITGGTLTPETDFLTALDDYGVQYNEKLIEMYVRFQGNRPNWSDGVREEEFYRLYEPSVSDENYYTPAVLQYAENFSDTAIVVVGRVAGETVDCPKVQIKKDPVTKKMVTDESRTYLEISTEEEELLRWAGETFERVIVLVNSVNTMNLGFLDEIEGLDACLIVGGTGNNAANALPKILYGEVSPSGKTVDTYVYDFATSSAYVNAGADGVTRYAKEQSADEDLPTPLAEEDEDDGEYYLDFSENIYVGYKWYETAYAEGFWSGAFALEHFGVSSYEQVVQFPFGYGLSYSSFSWEVESVSPQSGSALSASDRITVRVKVTNTGDTTARDVVQLYFSAPYAAGGIEKSAINLAAYAKTGELESGQSETVTLSFRARDMASYDTLGGNYVLDSGVYTVKLMTDAHHAKSCAQAELVYGVDRKITVTEDGATGRAIGNLFAGGGNEGVAADGSETEGGVIYLSRADFAGTFPLAKTEARTKNPALDEYECFTEEDAAAFMQDDGQTELPVTGAKNGIKLYDAEGNVNEIGLLYGDPANYENEELWGALLDQLTVAEMRNLVLHGYRQEESLDSLGKPKTLSADGPAQIGSFYSNDSGVGYPNPSVLAQSWNRELAESYGLQVGKEAGAMKYSGWYAPGANLHRSPFGGRNYEYYAEDSLLAGVTCAAVVAGAANAGVYCYIKHFAVYEQETCREGLYCWVSEQALREIYLSPFKRAIESGASGVMTGYSRLGGVWAGGNAALIRDLLRNEWGFRGTVITGYADSRHYMTADQMLCAGGDLWMFNWNNDGKFEFYDQSYDENPVFLTALRTTSKHVLYTVLHAAFANSLYNADAGNPIIKDGVKAFVWWIWLLVAINAVAVCSCGVWIYFAVKRKDAPEEDSCVSRPSDQSQGLPQDSER